MVQLLLGRRAEIEAKDKQGFTALAAACFHGHVAAATLLVDRHADIETRSNTGFTPLIWASQNGHVAVMELLCNRHADVNVLINGNTMSALSFACDNAHVEAARLLLARGADADLGNLPPIYMACSAASKQYCSGDDSSSSSSESAAVRFWARRYEIVVELVTHRIDHVLAHGPVSLRTVRRLNQPAIVSVLEEALGV